MKEPNAIIVRRAILSDLEAIVTFNTALAQETENRTLDIRVLKSGVKALLQDSNKGWYAVAEKDQDGGQALVMGQIMVTFEWSDWRNGNFWWIQSLYVHPNYRQQGIFRQLYRYVQQQALLNRESICGFRLYVEENNQHAHQAYTSLGFHETAYQMYEKELHPVSSTFLQHQTLRQDDSSH